MLIGSEGDAAIGWERENRSVEDAGIWTGRVRTFYTCMLYRYDVTLAMVCKHREGGIL